MHYTDSPRVDRGARAKTAALADSREPILGEINDKAKTNNRQNADLPQTENLPLYRVRTGSARSGAQPECFEGGTTSPPPGRRARGGGAAVGDIRQVTSHQSKKQSNKAQPKRQNSNVVKNKRGKAQKSVKVKVQIKGAHAFQEHGYEYGTTP